MERQSQSAVPSKHERRRTLRAKRRGVAVVIVLGVISIALALSYSLMRIQTTSLRIQANSSSRQTSRNALRTGLAVGFRKMHEAAWTVNSTYQGTITGGGSYSVSYTTGDSALADGSTELSKWPYRVTISVTASAPDPVNPSQFSESKANAVVALTPKNIPAEPASWNSMLANTVYQTGTGDFKVNFPARIQGPVRVQGQLRIAENYQWSSGIRLRYMKDLNLMRSNGYPDYRPFTGLVSLPYSKTSVADRTAFSADFGIPLADTPILATSDFNHPGALASYQLYTGSASYSPTFLSADIENCVLEADPKTNPLGIFVRNGTLTIRDNVTIRGTLIVTNELRFNGTGIAIEPAPLPALVGTSMPIQLPAALVYDNLVVADGSQSTLKGFVSTWGELRMNRGSVATRFDLQGHAVASKVSVLERTEWDVSEGTWNLLHFFFANQSAQPYFPAYVSGLFSPVSRLSLSPSSDTVRFHWQEAGGPVYTAHSSDPGLRWELVTWPK